MSAKFTVNGQNVTVSFEYTAPITAVQNVVYACAADIYRDAEPAFATLTNQQKLDIVDNYIKNYLVRMANIWKAEKAAEIAKNTELSNNYSL